jgi:hypothetical protein
MPVCAVSDAFILASTSYAEGFPLMHGPRTSLHTWKAARSTGARLFFPQTRDNCLFRHTRCSQIAHI